MSARCQTSYLLTSNCPTVQGVDLFEDLDPRSGVEMIVITGHATVESAVSALKMGATDYLVKPINMQRVKAILAACRVLAT